MTKQVNPHIGNIGRINPLIQCKGPGCSNMFTQYYISKKGKTNWHRPREYCSNKLGVTLINVNANFQLKRFSLYIGEIHSHDLTETEAGVGAEREI